MGVYSLPNTVTRQRRDCDLNPGPSAPESSTLTTRLVRYMLCLSVASRIKLVLSTKSSLGLYDTVLYLQNTDILFGNPELISKITATACRSS